jgi:hypothetical protein
MQAECIDVEMLLLDNEVGYLKNKLVEVCTFDYSAAILPLIRAYIWVSAVLVLTIITCFLSFCTIA